MIKRVIYTMVALAAIGVTLVSCYKEDTWGTESVAREGYVALHFTTNVPEMQVVETRSVDPDGEDVQNMTLFCFDSYGLFITTVTATLSPSTSYTGTFDAKVPDYTRTIHFVANENMSGFAEDAYHDRSEAEVMGTLEGSSGRMIYWARFACDPNSTDDIATQIEGTWGKEVTMIRNQAEVSVLEATSDTYMVITGMAVYNTNAFGTVAPYHPTYGFNFYAYFNFDPNASGVVWNDLKGTFVTPPSNDAKLSDVTLTSSTEQYLFETENSSSDPVSVILRGYPTSDETQTERYYRVLLIDTNGDYLPVCRNLNYQLNIVGELSYGQETLQAALEGPATNNVWISISDEVNEVENSDYILAVAQTSYVLDDGTTENTVTVTYTLTEKNSTTISADDAPTITWADNTMGASIATSSFTVDGDGVGQGQITISLPTSMGNADELEATLSVKKGLLERTIKIILIKEQSFAPSWLTTHVYGVVSDDDPTGSRSHITLMFTVPESCPEELLPLRVLISATNVDVRFASGESLTVVREGNTDEYYGESNTGSNGNGAGYKYLYMAEHTGTHRIYFENTLTDTSGVNGKVPITIEAEHFESMTHSVVFSNDQYSISLTGSGLRTWSGAVDELASDEPIYYCLVPQKKGADLQFDILLQDELTDPYTAIDAGQDDEFLFYTQYLSENETVQTPGVTFYPDASATWWQTYNPGGGRMLMFKPNSSASVSTGEYTIAMQTDRAKSAEIVRIASNQPGVEGVIQADDDQYGLYDGNSYRSVTFEVANYNAFRFAATVNEVGDTDGGATGSTSEVVTPLTWSYQPDQQVDIEFDVTSFEYDFTDGSGESVSVDPFGRSFEIYIDAPMLSIDESRLTKCNLSTTKLAADPNVSGRFIYTVAADRDTESNYGVSNAVNSDGLASSQSGERKRLPFVTNTAVSAGNIVISSDEDEVVYFSKQFSVTNASITGTLYYQDASTGTQIPVPASAFVPFERVRNGSRIGSMTITSDGVFELRLRQEYEFNWYTDQIEIYYTAEDGIKYSTTYDNLATFFSSTGTGISVVLLPSE